MSEIGEQVEELRTKGAEQIVLTGRSIEVSAAMSFAARRDDV